MHTSSVPTRNTCLYKISDIPLGLHGYGAFRLSLSDHGLHISAAMRAKYLLRKISVSPKLPIISCETDGCTISGRLTSFFGGTPPYPTPLDGNHTTVTPGNHDSCARPFHMPHSLNLTFVCVLFQLSANHRSLAPRPFKIRDRISAPLDRSGVEILNVVEVSQRNCDAIGVWVRF